MNVKRTRTIHRRRPHQVRLAAWPGPQTLWRNISASVANPYSRTETVKP